MAAISTRAADLVRLVITDNTIPRRVRTSAQRLAAVAVSDPDLVLDELELLRQRYVSTLPGLEPKVMYARCVSVETFYRHNTRDSVRRRFGDHLAYLATLVLASDPVVVLWDDWDHGDVTPAEYSWLVPYDDIRAMSTPTLKRHLRTPHDAPFVVFVLDPVAMHSAGGFVREPCALDAVPGRNSQWFRNNVADERIDGTLPASSVTRIEWWA